MVQFQVLFTELRHFDKNGVRHLSLIGRHLESVGRTEMVFELNLALSEERPTNKCWSDSGIFCYRVIVLSARSQRAKNRTEPFPGKIGRGIFFKNLVALATRKLKKERQTVRKKENNFI